MTRSRSCEKGLGPRRADTAGVPRRIVPRTNIGGRGGAVLTKPISCSRFKSVSASTSHALRRTAREQTSQPRASSLLKMTVVAKRFIQPFQQHPMGARSQLASKSEGRNLSWCGKHRQQGRLAAIKLEKEIKVLVEVASARAVPPPFLARGVLGTMRLGLKRIMQQGGSASFGPVWGGGNGGTTTSQARERSFYRGNITNKHDRGSIIKTKPRR